VRNVSDKSFRKIKTHILCSVTFPENRVVCNVEKCGGAREAADDNTANAFCIQGKAVCAHTYM
jgi:hypothetical protein